MVGYCDNGYRVWDPVKSKIVTTRSVIFDERKKQQDQRNVIIDLPNQISDTHMSESETSDEEIITMEENIAHRSRREKRLPKYLEFS